MKSKNIFTLLAALFAVAGAFAQGVETDDMYFNAKDRAKLNAQQATEQAAYASAKKTKQAPADDAVNPTDSYSARNVNPEYVARANAQTAKADDQDYFVNNYKYQNAANLNTWNSSFNNWYNNPWYSANYYNPSINSWNSPYYGSYYDPWGSPWYNPYYQSGWSSSFSYYWGSSYNYGWAGNPYYNMGMGMGMGYAWGGSPYYGNSMWGPSYGYNSGWYGYPVNTVVIVGESNHVNYGKRPSRGTAVASVPAARPAPTRTRNTNDYYYAPGTTGRSSYTGGRVSTPTSSTRQEDYYNRNYRTSQQSSYPDNNSSDWGNTRSGYSNYSNNSSNYGRTGGSNTNTYSAPSYHSTSGTSSFSGGGGGGGRGRTRD